MPDLITLPTSLRVSPQIEVLPPLRSAFLPLSELGNAQRFVANYGDRFRFVSDVGFYVFTGTHWKSEGAEHDAMLAVCEIPDLIKAEARAVEKASNPEFLASASNAACDGYEAFDPHTLTSADYAKQLRRWARVSGNSSVMRGTLRIAQSMLLVAREDFDRNKLALNVRNGTLKFAVDADGRAHATLYPHDASDMISRTCNASFDEDAECPMWLAHLEKTQPDEEMRLYLQRIFGYCATGLQTEQAFFVHQGRGGDGKSTTVDTVRCVMGGYAAVSDIRNFLAGERQSAESASPQMARLSGDIRLVSVSEPGRNAQLNEERIKAATGGAPMVARHLHGRPFEYPVHWKLMSEVNWLPEVQGTDEGIWRRAHLITWPTQIRAHERVGDLDKRILEAESDGVLLWIVRGVCKYLEQGLCAPEAAVRAVKAWRENSDQVGEWIAARVDTSDASAVVDQIALWEDYCDFCTTNGLEPRSSRWFSKEIETRGIAKLAAKDSRSRRVQRIGARLIELGSEAVDHGRSASMADLDGPCPF